MFFSLDGKRSVIFDSYGLTVFSEWATIEGIGKRAAHITLKRDYTFDPRLFINLTESLSNDTGKYVTIHNRNKSHTEVAERLGLSFDTTQVLRLNFVNNFGTCCGISR